MKNNSESQSSNPLSSVAIALFPFFVSCMYGAIVVCIIYFKKETYGYAPLILAGASGGIGALVLTIAHLDKGLQQIKAKLIRIGELFALLTVTLFFLGLFYPFLDIAKPSTGLYNFVLALVLFNLLIAACLLVFAFYRVADLILKHRKIVLKVFTGRE